MPIASDRLQKDINAHLSSLQVHLRGRLRRDVRLAPLTWLRTGGSCAALFEPADLGDLQTFFHHRPPDLPYLILGAGSNVLMRDGGFPGIVLRLSHLQNIASDPLICETQLPESEHVRDTELTFLIAEAGALNQTVARYAQERGLAGLSFLATIPGTIGGAVRMNAGCYGSEIKDVLVWADVIDVGGHLTRYSSDAFGFAYRTSDLNSGDIVVRAGFQLRTGDPENIAAEMRENTGKRKLSQPLKVKTGGSTFRNPPGEKAWELIDRAGCRAWRQGNAGFSKKHCNFLINHARATAHDLETLGERVRTHVLETTGVGLEWEIHRLGVKVAP